MFKLIIADDEGKTTVVPLVRDEVTIGRKEGNTIRLTDRNVSRRHARLVRRDNGFLVEDLDSYNGIRLNGVPVLSPKPANDGDQITIGDYQLSVRSDRPAAAVPPQLLAPADPPPHPRLVMLGPPDPGREFLLDGPEVVIGRTDENAVVINHRSISRSHAKVVVDNGVCRLHDLDSANGVRVNGEDFKNVELRRGDLVELGTVRLRFVAAGEAYQFDADATVQIDAIPEDLFERKSSTVPILVAVVVLLLLGVGGYVAFTWPRDDGTSSGGTAGSGVTPRTPSGEPPGPEVAEVKAQARDLIERELYAAALSALAALGPAGDDEVFSLRARANAEQEAFRIWQSACVETDQAELAGVHETCQRIDRSSRYRDQGCCAEAAERLGASRVAEARRMLLDRDYERAVALALAVAGDRGMPEPVRQRAEEVAGRAQKRLEAPAPTPGPVETPGKVRPPGPPTPTPTPTKATRVPADQAMAEARACLTRGNDQRCCIRALQGAEQTTQVVTLLISCYEGAGRIDAACALARRYPRCRPCQAFAETRCR